MEALESYLHKSRKQLYSSSPYPGHYFRFLLRRWVDSVKYQYFTSAKMVKNAAVALIVFAVIALPFKWKATAKEKELENFINTIKLISVEESKVQLTPSQMDQTIFLLKQLGVESTISEESVDDTYYRHPKSPKS